MGFIRCARARILGRKLGMGLAIVAMSAVVAACGGDGDDPGAATLGANPPANPPSNPPATPPANPPSNQAPTIAGSPSGTVMQDHAYTFTPTATDPDGDTFTFSIANKPGWASFDSATGALTGTPTAANVGNYQNIRITVSDGQASMSLASFSINVVATASGAATLSWTPPTTNTDGTAVALTGYKIYWGTTQGNYPNSKTLNAPGVTSAVVDQLTPAKYYFVVTAVGSDGAESGYSNVATKTVL